MSKSLLKSTSIVAALTIITRIFGFVRDISTAQIFGASSSFDAFTIAFRIPNFMRRLFAEGAFSAAFVPILSSYKPEDPHTKQFINTVCGNLSLILLIVTVCGIIFSPEIISLFAPGYNNNQDIYNLTVNILRITFPYLFLISLTAFASSILNAHNKYWVGAFTPILLNLSMIGAMYYLAPLCHPPIMCLAWGVVIAGILQLTLPVITLAKHGIVLRPRISWNHPGVKRLLKLIIPSIFGVSVAQINLIVNSAFASMLQIGSLSWLYYSDRLLEFPLGVFGVAIATVILPHLSQTKNNKNYSLIIDWAIKLVLLIGLPATVGIIVLAVPLLSTLFRYGNFTESAVMMSSKSLIMLGIGVTPCMLIKIFAASFYAQQNISIPVRTGIIAMIANILLNCLLIVPLAHAGIALATALASLINASGLLIYLHKSSRYLSKFNWVKFIGKLCFANIIMGQCLWWAKADNHIWLMQDTSWRIMHLSILIVFAVTMYFICLRLVGIRPRNFMSPSAS